MRRLITDEVASAVPVILFIVTLFACGGLYTLFFLEIGLPLFSGYIPTGDAKTFILMCMYAIPMFVIVVGVFSLLLAGLKRQAVY